MTKWAFYDEQTNQWLFAIIKPRDAEHFKLCFTFLWWFLCIRQADAQIRWRSWNFAQEKHENIANKDLRRPSSWGLGLQEPRPHAADDRGPPNKPHKTFSWSFLQIVVEPNWGQEFRARGALFQRPGELWAMELKVGGGLAWDQEDHSQTWNIPVWLY